MRHAALISLLGFFSVSAPAPALGNQNPSAQTVSVRPIERSSSDIFEVLSEFMKAKQAYEAGDYSQSLTRYRTVLLHDPVHIEARLGLGHSALELDYMDLANDVFAGFSDDSLSDGQTRRLIIGQSLSLPAALSSKEEETRLKTALARYPRAPRLWAALGDNQVRAKDYYGASYAYNQAREQGYSGAKYAYKFGLMNLAQAQYKTASDRFKTAAKLAPNELLYDTHYRLALLLGGDYISAFEQMPPERAGHILGEAGALALQRGEYELARRCLTKALEVSPSYNVQAAQNLAALKAELQ